MKQKYIEGKPEDLLDAILFSEEDANGDKRKLSDLLSNRLGLIKSKLIMFTTRIL